MMETRSKHLSVMLCWTFLISNNVAHAIETGKTPLNVDNPISGTPGDSKDGKMLDTRYNDPPPEYYKGPSGGSDRDRYDSYDLKYNGHSQRPLPNIGGSGHINPYLSKHGFYGAGSNKDRISVHGYYGSGGGGGDYGGSGGSSYERNRPYGPPQAVDISSSANHGYYDSYENQNGLDWQQNNYGGIWNEKLNYLSKSNFVPIAGAALLGIAAALIVNPVLLQLGPVAGKRRRRRDTVATQRNDGDDAHGMAYRNQNGNTGEAIL